MSGVQQGRGVNGAALRIAPSDGSYKTFCDILTGYRLASVITQAVKTGIIETVGPDGCSEADILEATGMRTEEGGRFLALLVRNGILERYDEQLYLSQFSRKYLYRDSASNQLDVLEFEQILADNWNSLDTILNKGQGALTADKSAEEYASRLNLFQSAMHEAAIVRSKELWDAFPPLADKGVIIDVGAGDGTYLKEFLARHPHWQAIACDLAEVVAQIKDEHITRQACNLLDAEELKAFITLNKGTASIVVVSNIIHCYSRQENTALLEQLKEIVHQDGLLVIHDFFTDGNSFGALYDLHMMVNTYNGRAYSFDDTVQMLAEAGFSHANVIELPSYSHAIIASRQPQHNQSTDLIFQLRQKALSLGFFEAEAIDTASISIEAWVKAKCTYGCMFYGKKWSCPPNSMSADEFRELLGCYSKAIVVAGQPPLQDFQRKLLDLEAAAFLNGSKKALVFSGGPCTWCESCDVAQCRFPEKRRPSLESCGCDVFALAESCGISVQPIKSSADFVQYIGLLLVE